jgi:hypothetical protein
MLFKTILIYFLENTMLKISDSFLIAKLPPHMRLILMTIARDVCGKIGKAQIRVALGSTAEILE